MRKTSTTRHKRRRKTRSSGSSLRAASATCSVSILVATWYAVYANANALNSSSSLLVHAQTWARMKPREMERVLDAQVEPVGATRAQVGLGAGANCSWSLLRASFSHTRSTPLKHSIVDDDLHIEAMLSKHWPLEPTVYACGSLQTRTELCFIAQHWQFMYLKSTVHVWYTADVREPRRDDGLQQPAPALPVLVHWAPARRGARRASLAARLPTLPYVSCGSFEFEILNIGCTYSYWLEYVCLSTANSQKLDISLQCSIHGRPVCRARGGGAGGHVPPQILWG